MNTLVVEQKLNETFFLEQESNRLREMREHQVFSKVRTVTDLKLFMEWHVFAVWDFMSLVKRLQNDFTCTSIPWTPPKNRVAARLINDIVLGEESDEMPGSHTGSHFHMYLAAMKEVGADTRKIIEFVELVEQGTHFETAMETVSVPLPIRKFIKSTLDVCMNGTTEEVLGSFFYGREDSIPDMFTFFLKSWTISENEAPIFKYYLERHIELDGDDHGPAVQKIIKTVINGDSVKENNLYISAKNAINNRIEFWDSLLKIIND